MSRLVNAVDVHSGVTLPTAIVFSEWTSPECGHDRGERSLVDVAARFRACPVALVFGGTRKRQTLLQAFSPMRLGHYGKGIALLPQLHSPFDLSSGVAVDPVS